MELVFAFNPKWAIQDRYYDALQKGGATHWLGSYFYAQDKTDQHLQDILNRVPSK